MRLVDCSHVHFLAVTVYGFAGCHHWGNWMKALWLYTSLKKFLQCSYHLHMNNQEYKLSALDLPPFPPDFRVPLATGLASLPPSLSLLRTLPASEVPVIA